MLTEFKLPSLGENVESGDIVNVLVQEGQTIQANDGVVELETEKAVVELPCPYAGKVVKLQVKKGDRVRVGQTLLTLETEAKGPADEAPTRAAKPQPRLAEPEGKTPGAERSDAPAAVTAGASLGFAAGPPPVVPAASRLIPAGPAARRLARELGVDLGRVRGTGERGRITTEDVRAAATRPAATTPAAIAPPATAPATAAPPTAEAAGMVGVVEPPGEPGRDAWGPVRRQRMSQIRRTIAAQMARSASTIPHVTNFDDADVTELEHLRKGIPEGFLGPGLKLTTMPFILRAVATALPHHPLLNATLDAEKDEIVYKQYVNLGVAVATPRGLVVPVIRDADRLSIAGLARAVAALAERARTARFPLEELRGGTFTLSNLGAVGGTYSTPIINYPEVAILLLGRSRWLPVVRDGQVVSRLMLPLSLSYDHRLVDGAAAARFLNDVIDLLQTPGKLVLA